MKGKISPKVTLLQLEKSFSFRFVGETDPILIREQDMIIEHIQEATLQYELGQMEKYKYHCEVFMKLIRNYVEKELYEELVHVIK